MNEIMKKSVDALKEITTKISADPVYAQALEDEFKKSFAPRGTGPAAPAGPAKPAGMAKPAMGVKPPTAPKMPKMAMPKMSMKAEPAAAAKPNLKAMMAKTDEHVAKLGKARIDEGQSDANKRLARRPDAGHRSGGANVFDASQGPKVKGGHVAAAKVAAKDTLQRIQAAPKPNLGKATGGNPAKAHVAVKGVHKPVMSPNSGSSAMGVVSNPAQKKALATQVVKEQAVMKKPNLPKAEPAAAPAPAPALRAPVKPPLRQLLKESDGWMKKCGMMKADNLDEKEDAKLGETVENVVENHMLANKEAEKKEGHKILKDK